MEVLKEIGPATAMMAGLRQSGKSIGFVPTMGALHKGHLSLIERSSIENDMTLASIFVNPVQFNNKDDFSKYPTSIEEDIALLEKEGCSIVFIPSVDEIYSEEPQLQLSFGHLETIMEAKHRPGHFNGVAIIVAKLFNILAPTRAYFGQKDLQQYKIIERLVNDLSFNVELRMMPIIREENGLAMSSRNRRLSASGVDIAGEINKSMGLASDEIQSGSSVDLAVKKAHDHLDQFNEISIEYINIVNLEDLSEVRTGNSVDPLVLCFAGYIEGIRLIDNLIIER